MIIEHGDITNPTGNAVIFWRIKGNSKLLKNAEIVASNFVVSPLQSNEETLMVNFPPVLIDNHDKLLKIAETNNIDLIRGGEIYVPEEITDFSSFYKKQIEKYNGIIREYLVAFKEKNNTAREKTVEDRKVSTNLPRLFGQASETLTDLRRKVKGGAGGEVFREKMGKLRDIQDAIRNEMVGSDLDRLLVYIRKPDEVVDTLVELYCRKLFALFLEDYETADTLKREIRSLESDHGLFSRR
jgi:hypothetical protein